MAVALRVVLGREMLLVELADHPAVRAVRKRLVEQVVVEHLGDAPAGGAEAEREWVLAERAHDAFGHPRNDGS